MNEFQNCRCSEKLQNPILQRFKNYQNMLKNYLPEVHRVELI